MLGERLVVIVFASRILVIAEPAHVALEALRAHEWVVCAGVRNGGGRRLAQEERWLLGASDPTSGVSAGRRRCWKCRRRPG
jgi:hypothetical protein